MTIEIEAEAPFRAPDNRNIQDKYKWWLHENIVEDLDSHRSNLVNMFVNISHDMNLGSGVRNSNWFNTQPVVIAGSRKWDKRGAVGAYKYTGIEHYPSAIEAIDIFRSQGYRIVAAEIDELAVPLTSYEWDNKSVVIYGEEGDGLSQDILSKVDDIVYIPGRGSVRSLNVATTSGIFTYDYSSKVGLI